MIAIVTGPVRSGKSTRALQIARGLGLPVTYVATARVDPADSEMADRVARHRAERTDLASLELWSDDAPELAAVVAGAGGGSVLVIDSLGTWIAGYLLDLEPLAERDPVAALAELDARTSPLIAALAAVRAHVVIVAEEAGWGVVPPSALGRIFRDHLGRFVRRIVPLAERIELVVAGFAVDLRAAGERVED